MNDARTLANLFCLYAGSNPTFAKRMLGTWCYKDAIVLHNLQAFESERCEHLTVLRKKLQANSITVKEVSRCDCNQCWAMILEGNDPYLASKARQLLFDSAFEVVKVPSIQVNNFDHPIEPADFPTVKLHVEFYQSSAKAWID